MALETRCLARSQGDKAPLINGGYRRLPYLERLQWVRDVIEESVRLRTPVTIQTRALNCAVGTGLFLASSTQSYPNTPSVDAWEVRVADHWHDQTAWIMTE
jgi:hypothetical protein